MNSEAVKAVALGKVLVECFSDEERKELMREAIKPYFVERDNGYGKPKTSLFQDKVLEAFGYWAAIAVREHCAQPDVRADMEKRIRIAIEKALEEKLQGWVEEILGPSKDKF